MKRSGAGTTAPSNHPRVRARDGRGLDASLFRSPARVKSARWPFGRIGACSTTQSDRPRAPPRRGRRARPAEGARDYCNGRIRVAARWPDGAASGPPLVHGSRQAPPAGERPYVVRLRRQSQPKSAPSTSPPSGARGRSVVTLTTMPSASPSTTPMAMAAPTPTGRVYARRVAARDNRESGNVPAPGAPAACEVCDPSVAGSAGVRAPRSRSATDGVVARPGTTPSRSAPGRHGRRVPYGACAAVWSGVERVAAVARSRRRISTPKAISQTLQRM
jgi:hypothetical protein